MVIALLGDIAFLGRCSSQNNNIDFYFSELNDYLKKFDYVVGNLESPFSKEKHTFGAKSAYVCADPVDVQLLSKLHVNAVTLANNHMYDYGTEGVTLTKKLLETNNIAYFGIDGIDHKIEICGNKLSFTGFCCYSTNPLQTVPYGKNGVNEFNVQKATEKLIENSQNGFLNIFSIHAGVEHTNFPSIDTIKVARKLAKICPYIYYGHHPHVVQGIEEINNSLIAYSLGNFCFDDVYTSISTEPLVELSENNRSSIILEIKIENNRIISYKTTPIFIGKEKMTVGSSGISNEQLKEFSTALNIIDESSYNLMRNETLQAYYGKRRAQRDLSWVVKRIKLRYFKLFFTNRINAKKYVQCVKKYIN